MRSDQMSDWPDDFDKLCMSIPEGWTIRSTVVEPILRVSRVDSRYFVSLVSISTTRRGGDLLLSAPRLECNWVAGDSLIYPLPIDCGDTVREALCGRDPEDLRFSGVLALRAASGAHLQVVLDDSVTASASEMAEEHSGTQVVPGLRAKLYPYQAQGVAWMRQAVSTMGGALLADEMGLGKTVQVLSLLLLTPPSGTAPALILCPTTLIANWMQEIEKFAPTLTVKVHRGSTRANLPRELLGTDIVLTTYDTAVNDLVLFRAIEWSWMICDEAQALKNPDSQRRRAVGQIPRRRMLPVTGTPMEVKLLDLWSLIDLAIPLVLGPRASFESEYPDTAERATTLGALVAPIVLRRRVSDVATDLPERTDVVVPLELTDDLARSYEKTRSYVLEHYGTAGALVATGQLQQFCADPRLLRPLGRNSNVAIDLSSIEPPLSSTTPKLERASELIQEAVQNGRKVLVFSNYNAVGPILREAVAFSSNGYWNQINGSTPQAHRQAIVEQFSMHSGPSVLVLNPRAAGAGLNIAAATVVIHFTQVWNPALEAQASARAHRRGQTLPVTVYHLYYLNTVEQVMLERAQMRRELGDGAVQSSADFEDHMTRALTISPIRR